MASTSSLSGDNITLDLLLRASGIVSRLGAAKPLIADGGVGLSGAVETRRGRKLRARDAVALGDSCVRVR